MKYAFAALNWVVFARADAMDEDESARVPPLKRARRDSNHDSSSNNSDSGEGSGESSGNRTATIPRVTLRAKSARFCRSAARAGSALSG